MTDESIEISFSDAYEELKGITERLNNEEVEADALVELLRRGKGLEAALRDHLTNIEQEVEAIESGEGIAAYRITRAEIGETSADVPADTSDFAVPEDTIDADPGPTAEVNTGKDDDIPF